MRYLLDTCVISDFIKGELGTQVKLKQTLTSDIAISRSSDDYGKLKRI